jgi:hypothetical protein
MAKERVLSEAKRKRREPSKRPIHRAESHHAKQHTEALLDAALELTFPASDPVAICVDRMGMRKISI